MDDIKDETLLALGFHIFTTGYLEEGSLCFIDITNLELNAKLAVVDNSGQVVIDLEEEVVKKKNKRAAKSKEWFVKLRSPVESPLSPRPKSSSFLLPRFVPAFVTTLVPAFLPVLMPALVPTLVPAPFSYPGSPFFCYLVMLLFFVAEFQLFCHLFLVCSIQLFLLDLHLLEHSNGPCQMSLGSAYQPALESLFVCSWLLVHTIQLITTNASGV